ncbi:glutaredoxin family protein [Clostridium psychrophilum]|uniref:glutaredoxin family protein n=1 Tax=Clostridium psychrophilum TaxID=132926 RepID=UPI001C0D0BFB|nr:glutaredoxin family protein [Clostridium psychrophilum]MBU3181543.1 glutaredoxin family protein [Clostridium psychrophilum]
MSIKVYSTPACPWCTITKDYLRSKNFSFEDVDVSKNRKAAMEMVKKSGQRGVPVIDINGKIIVGFDQATIDKLLKA